MLSPACARFCTASALAAWPEATRDRRHPALERRDPLLEHVVGRVHDAGIDVAELLQREQARGVGGVVELVAGGLIDRDGDGLGRRVAPPTGVQRDRLGVLALHWAAPFSRQ